jgi:CBS domain containing-hemolysin-like protein
MNVELPTADSDTLGGFIYSELGKVPVVGNRVVYEDMAFTVESVAGRRIKKVRVERDPTLVMVEQKAENSSFFHRNGNQSGREW